MPVFHNKDGSTLIDDITGLIPSHITLKKELDEWESENILSAVQKYLSRKVKFILSPEGIKQVHKDMFNKTWKWAGQFRNKNLNMGVSASIISVEIKKLTDDAAYWLENNSFDILEQSVRIHHRLVAIHPFFNGNGRHARLVADIILHNAGIPMPHWPEKEIVDNTNIRKDYISALKNADTGDFGPLIAITKSLIK